MPALSSLLVDLQVNTAALRKGLDDAKGLLASFGKSVGDISKQLKELQEMKGVEWGKELVEGLAEFVQKGAEAAEQAGRLAQATGIPVEQFSRLAYAANVTGLSSDDLAKSLEKLDKNLAAAGAGAVQQTALFNALGVAVKDSSGNVRPVEDVLGDLAQTFSGLQDGASKTALAIQVFGKSGAQLIPFLNEGRAGIKELEEEADRLGITLTGQAAASAKGFEDNVKKLELAVNSIATRVAGDLTPALKALTDSFIASDTASSGLKTTAQDLTVFIKGLASVVTVVAAVFEGLGAQVGKAASIVANVVERDWGALKEDLAHPFEGITEAIDTASKRLDGIWAKGNQGALDFNANLQPAKKSADAILASISKTALALDKLRAAFTAKDEDALWAGKAKSDAEILRSSAKTDLEAGQRRQDFGNIGAGPLAIFNQITAGFSSFSEALAKWTLELKLAANQQAEVKLEEEAAQRARSFAEELRNKGDEKGAEDALALAAQHEQAAQAAQVLADQHDATAAAADRAAKAFDAAAKAADEGRKQRQKIYDEGTQATPKQRLEEIGGNLSNDVSAAINTNVDLGTRWEALKRVGTDLTEAVGQVFKGIGQSLTSVSDMGAAVGVFAKGITSKLGDLGQTINAGFQGFQTAGIWGAIAGVMADILSRAKGFQQLIDIGNGQLQQALLDMAGPINDIIGGLRQFMGGISGITGALHTILGPIFTFLGQILTEIAPILEAFGASLRPIGIVLQSLLPILNTVLKPILQLVGNVFLVLAEVAYGIILAIQGIWEQILEAAISVYSSLGGDASALVKLAGENQVNMRQEQEQMSNLWNGGLGGLADQASASADAAEALGKSADKAATSINKMTEQLTNVPQGYKIALARFTATNPIGPGGTASGPPIHIDKLEVKAASMTDLYNSLVAVHRRMAFNSHGG